jgi:hypothetical protein
VLRHPDAISQQRAAGERARGVNSDHANRFSGCSHEGSQAINYARLPSSRRASDADGKGIPEPGCDSLKDWTNFVPIPLNQGHESSKGNFVASSHSF